MENQLQPQAIRPSGQHIDNPVDQLEEGKEALTSVVELGCNTSFPMMKQGW